MAGNFRKAGKEQYYTLPATAELYASEMVRRYGTGNKWLEPSGGKGDLINALIKNGVSPDNILSFDIEPHHELVLESNFLETNFDGRDFIAFGNPPFGRACSLAIKFFNKCAENSIAIGFIIPPSFNKPSIQDQLNEYYHQVFVDRCPAISFYDGDGNPHEGGLLRTDFQIWERRDYPRTKMQSYRSDKFTFVKKEQPFDIAFRTHGNGAGIVLPDGDYNPRTTAFIKLNDERALQAIKESDYSFYYNSTSHIPCLAPAEISLCVDEWYRKNPQ